MTSSNGNISTLLVLCEGNLPVTVGFPSQRPVTWKFDVFFDLRLKKQRGFATRKTWTCTCDIRLRSTNRYTSRSRTLERFCLHVATWALTNRRIDTSKWHDTSPLTTFANKSERTLPNDILAQGRGDYMLQLSVIFASVFAFIAHWDVHGMTLRELTGYTWKSRRVACSLPWTMLQRTQVLMTSHPLVLFYTYTFTFYV